MGLKQIIEKLEQIKKDIEDAFENELIDFDDLENDISSIIEAVENLKYFEQSSDTITVSVGNFI